MPLLPRSYNYFNETLWATRLLLHLVVQQDQATIDNQTQHIHGQVSKPHGKHMSSQRRYHCKLQQWHWSAKGPQQSVVLGVELTIFRGTSPYGNTSTQHAAICLVGEVVAAPSVDAGGSTLSTLPDIGLQARRLESSAYCLCTTLRQHLSRGCVPKSSCTSRKSLCAHPPSSASSAASSLSSSRKGTMAGVTLAARHPNAGSPGSCTAAMNSVGRILCV